MKTHTLSLILLAASCSSGGGNEQGPVQQPATVPARIPDFRNTPDYREEEILRTASDWMKHGRGIPGKQAERCLDREESRPGIQAACLLLWATEGEFSARLESFLEERMFSDRAILFAAWVRKSPLHKVPASRLPELLRLVDGDPLWVRAGILYSWRENNPVSDRDLIESLLPRIHPGPASGPADLGAALPLLFLLSPPHWQEVFGAYCDPGVRGLARTRCWRLLGFLAGPSLPDGLMSELKPYLPRERDKDWAFFRFHFPRLAFQIEKYFSKELL